MTALAALTAADLRALADVEEPRFARYWASGVWFHAGDSGGWRGIGWAVWMECAARAWIPPHAGSLTAWGVTDGRALVHLAYDEDEARSWAVDARAQHRNRNMLPPVYSVVRLAAAVRSPQRTVTTNCPRWIAFADALPPLQCNGRGDTDRRKVLVTNNIDARDSYGDPSHVWLGRPRHDENDGWYVFDGGRYLTHWADPFARDPAPAQMDARSAFAKFWREVEEMDPEETAQAAFAAGVAFARATPNTDTEVGTTATCGRIQGE